MININTTNELKKILRIFKITNTFVGYEEMNMGHINNTYLVHTLTDDGKNKSYVAQKINTYVFKNPNIVMHNIDLVTEHIRKKNKKEALHFHHTEDGANYYVSGDGFWRLYTFVDGVAYNESYTPEVIFNAGKAFGKFQIRLADFPVNELKESIPDFHNTKKRFDHFLNTIEKDPLGRANEVKEEIEYLKSVTDITLKISNLMDQNALPVRPTHNDTKVNNTLLNRVTNEPLCVIDLDTVMPGTIVHDFGDAIRYIGNTAAEDEADLSKVHLSMDAFKSFADGFVLQVKYMLTTDEVETLALGVLSMTFECGMRFLDDYIDGDNYFKIAYEKHNLVRARNQIALLKDMIKHLSEMDAYIQKIVEC